MFRRRRKSECHRIREIFAPYLDDRVTSVERDAVRYHIEICDDCQWELRSLAATVQLLSRVPVVAVSRSFTLAEAPPRQDWFPFAVPGMTRLRMATAAAVLVLAILLAGDFSGLLHTDVIVAADPADPGQQEQVVRDVEEPELPAEGEMPVLAVDDHRYEKPVAEEPVYPDYPSDQVGITQWVDQEEEIGNDFPGFVDIPGMVDAIPPTRKPYPWLLPFQIAFAVLVLVLGGANLLVRQRKRGLPQLKRS